MERCDCLVLRRVRFSESSLVLTLLDRERGRFDALAKGCRRPGSPMLGHLDLYRREECVVYPRRQGLDLVTQAALAEEWHGIGRTPVTLAAAGLLAEVAVAACLPGDPQPEVFDTLVSAWSRLDTIGRQAEEGGRSGRAAAAVAGRGMTRLLRFLGFAPRLEGCAGCGGVLPEGRRLGFSGVRGGLLCRGCVGQGVFFVGPWASAWLRHWAIADGQAEAVPSAGVWRDPSREAPEGAVREGVLALARYAGEVIGWPLRAAEVLAKV